MATACRHISEQNQNWLGKVLGRVKSPRLASMLHDEFTVVAGGITLIMLARYLLLVGPMGTLLMTTSLLLSVQWLLRPRNFPPGPWGLPVLGNLHQIAVDPMKSLTEFGKKYGDVYSIRIGMDNVVILCGWDAFKEAIVNKADEFRMRPSHLYIYKEYADSKGIGFVNDATTHRLNRKFVLKTLKEFGLGKQTLEEDIAQEARYLCHQIYKHDGKPIGKMGSMLTRSSAGIILRLVFGKHYEWEDPEFKLFVGNITRGFELMTMYGAIFNVYPWLRYIPYVKSLGQAVMDNMSDFKKLILDKIEQHRSSRVPGKPRDLVDAFFDELEDNSGVNDFSHLLPMVADLLTAGMETTATTLHWTALYMALYPDVQRKVQDELEAAVGKGKAPTLADVSKLPFTEATIKEIQRICNVAPLAVPRMTTTDVELRGYHIPKGTQVCMNLYTVHMDPKYFSEPEVFNPNRFLGDDGKVQKMEAFAPFSAGRRVCIGEQMARNELLIFFTTMMTHFTFKLPEGAPTPDLSKGKLGITLSPPDFEVLAVRRTSGDIIENI
ncbi:cytochrome P450 2J6-like isoform X1 [Branchiostoma floridae]|uniref:Steroid 21-hydroxylase n=1 Tax=Branchiostoma floridae TaxID=7739 RepID=A0A9J7KU07_BRAFL|nr:cytochrome P450 2J6-like isoform X1 [Branchiostoma floridae]